MFLQVHYQYVYAGGGCVIELIVSIDCTLLLYVCLNIT